MYRSYIAAYGDNIDAIKAAAPSDFEVSADEVAGFLTEGDALPPVKFYPNGELMPGEPSSNLAFDPQSGMTIAPVRTPRPLPATDDAPSAVDAPQAPDVTREQAHAALRAADMDLAECRLNVRRTQAAVNAAKIELQKQIEIYVKANPNPLSAEINARNFAASALEDRRKRAALFGTGESASARRFVQKRMTGYGPKRGGQSYESAARTGYTVPGSPASMAPHDFQADVRARAGLTAAAKPTQGVPKP